MAFALDNRMLRRLAGSALACGLLLAATPATAQFGGGGPCSREDLQSRVNDYIATQTSGDTTKIKMVREWFSYQEQFDIASMLSGMLSKPQKIDFHRSLFDTRTCQSFTEVVITDVKHPYVLGVLTNGSGPRMSSMEMLVTDQGDWLFNAANTLKYSKAENWSVIPEAQRDSRETIVAAADAYLDLFDDKSVQVPWGSPCARLEGGLYTAKGGPGVVSPGDTCNVGVPSGVKLIERRYVVDEALGAVAVLLKFGEKERPDAHIFRVENGKIRYVHTITVCADEPNCGLPLPDQLQQASAQ